MSETFLLVVQVFFAIADFSFFCCSVIGNSVVIYVISRDKNLKSKSSYHILSVACADLLIGLFGIPLGVTAGITGWPHDLHLCLLLNSFLLAVFAVSMFSLLAVSVDRCWAVCFPLTYHVKGPFITKIIIAACWIFGIFFGFLPVLGWHSGKFVYKCDLRIVADFNYLLFICVAIAGLSALAIIILYAQIYRAILKQAKRRQQMVANTSEAMKQRREIKAAITLALVVLTFLVLWTPGIICLFIIAFTQNRDFPLDALQFATILVHLNAAIDPIIYAYRMNNIREQLKKVLKFYKRDAVSEGSSSGNDKSRSSRSVRTKSSITLVSTLTLDTTMMAQT